MDKIYDMIIIGGGPAGYTAALYGARAGLSTLVMEKMVVGGQMALTDKIDNYPGFEDGIEGLSLGEKMKMKLSVPVPAQCLPRFCLQTLSPTRRL